MGTVRVGTCSWTDKTMLKAWYPSGVSSAEARLRYYAQRFDTVEADSTFYALPARRITELWAERTPPGFMFHVKAYGLMTKHHPDARALAPELRSFPHEVNPHGRVTNAHPDMVDASFDLFLDALEPLRRTDRLGGILMQFPPFFTAKDDHHRKQNEDYLLYARAKLAGYHMLVEFRHPSWVAGPALDKTLAFLSEHAMSYVSVDAPQFEGQTTMPPLAEATADWAYVRLHGRNREMYFANTETAADRFDYLYTEDELDEWQAKIRDLAGRATQTFVMFNNCRNDYAPTNAKQMATILGDLVPPAPEPELPLVSSDISVGDEGTARLF